MQIGRRKLDLHAAFVLVAVVQVFEQRDVIIQRELQAGEPALRGAAQVGWQGSEEIVVTLIDEPVLVAYCETVGDAHADVLVGADHLVGARFDLGEPAGRPAVDVLHRGNSGSDHLEGRIERVEIQVHAAHHHARDEPQFERHVGRAELHRRQADMVVAVDEAGQQDVFAAADDWHGRVLAMQVGERACRRDDAVFLQHRAVSDFVPGVTVHRVGDHRAAADQRCGHVRVPRQIG